MTGTLLERPHVSHTMTGTLLELPRLSHYHWYPARTTPCLRVWLTFTIPIMPSTYSFTKSCAIVSKEARVYVPDSGGSQRSSLSSTLSPYLVELESTP